MSSIVPQHKKEAWSLSIIKSYLVEGKLTFLPDTLKSKRIKMCSLNERQTQQIKRENGKDAFHPQSKRRPFSLRYAMYFFGSSTWSN